MDFNLLAQWYTTHRWYGGIMVFLLGLCVGSFLNVCIYRIPNKLSVRTPPSHCPDCKARLSALDMIPVASWLFLGGKCRHCGKKISPRYIAVELLTGLLFLMCFWRLPGFARLIPALALTSVLVASAFIDAENSIIPNGLVLFGAVSGVVSVVATGQPHYRDALMGVVAGGAPLLAIDIVSRLILRKDGMGGGDVKLMMMAGLFLGWQATLMALLLAIVAGGVAGTVLLVSRRMKKGDYFPFGPFLAAGTFASLVFGTTILQGYAAFNQCIVGLLVG